MNGWQNGWSNGRLQFVAARKVKASPWLARLEREADNTQAALHWLLAAEQAEMAAEFAAA